MGIIHNTNAKLRVLKANVFLSRAQAEGRVLRNEVRESSASQPVIHFLMIKLEKLSGDEARGERTRKELWTFEELTFVNGTGNNHLQIANQMPMRGKYHTDPLPGWSVICCQSKAATDCAGEAECIWAVPQPKLLPPPSSIMEANSLPFPTCFYHAQSCSPTVTSKLPTILPLTLVDRL